MAKNYDIIVIGGGHAGIEAASSGARMGFSVGLITLEKDAIGRMSCNPAIGGTAKGHLVKEIDALGGAMGELADKTGIQFKMLNTSKGPAVWSSRCQSDKDLYTLAAIEYLDGIEGLDIIRGMVNALVVEDYKENGKEYRYKIKGVKTENGEDYRCKCVIITTGTFLNAVMHTGRVKTNGGRYGEKAVTGLSECMSGLGFETGRLKTGTPPRLLIDSIDFSKTEVQPGDKNPIPFSHRTNPNRFPVFEQINCYLTHTNEETHNILRTGFEDSPLFKGIIKGAGPRYCPSIEDKISRFSDKSRHQIFLEPEILNGHTIYMNGFSSSLPEDIQLRAARTVPGLENVKFLRSGYAVEYDFFPTHHIGETLETKLVSGLFNAGQVNGTSGYEEAAGQGLIAGINAALKLKNEAPFVLKRSDAYIGVLIDDLIIKCPDEPYRMFTSSAEYRLILRQDNADIRLMKKGYLFGLVEKHHVDNLDKKIDLIYEGFKYLSSNTISPKNVNTLLIQKNSSEIRQNEFMSNLIKRSEISLLDILSLEILSDTPIINKIKENRGAAEQIETEIKYDGYIRRQNEQVINFNRNEEIRIPEDFRYENIKSLSSEALDKLKKIKPASIGQATRIAGVRPSDISAIIIYMRG